jgi:hypothetical protein
MLALEQVGIQFVSSLAQSATTIISQGLPMMMGAMMGPMGAAAATNAASKQQTKGGSAKENSKSQKSLGQSNLPVPDASDPAYKAAVEAVVPVTLLATLLGAGTTTGVDWDHLTPPAEKGKESAKGLKFVETVLKHLVKSTQWTDGAPSSQLRGSVDKMLEVIAAVKKEASKDKDLTAEKVKNDSPIVKAWQDSVVDAKIAITKLSTTASSLPGSAPGAAPMLGKTPQASNSGDQSGMNAALQSAQEKLSVTEAAYTSAQANYQKTVENRSKVQAELARIKSSLQSMQLTQAKMV